MIRQISEDERYFRTPAGRSDFLVVGADFREFRQARLHLVAEEGAHVVLAAACSRPRPPARACWTRRAPAPRSRPPACTRTPLTVFTSTILRPRILPPAFGQLLVVGHHAVDDAVLLLVVAVRAHGQRGVAHRQRRLQVATASCPDCGRASRARRRRRRGRRRSRGPAARGRRSGRDFSKPARAPSSVVRRLM